MVERDRPARRHDASNAADVSDTFVYTCVLEAERGDHDQRLASAEWQVAADTMIGVAHVLSRVCSLLPAKGGIKS